MKILFTGGGSGGHFYPIIAIVEELDRISQERKMIPIKKYYMASMPYDERLLFDNDIHFVKVTAGKTRRYASFANLLDIIKTLRGLLMACVKMFSIFPDVVFGKGGYDSFPALFAARLFKIPVFIHESDSKPGRVNRWTAKFARRIAIGFPTAADQFPKEKVAYTGNPILKELTHLEPEAARNFLKIKEGVPVVLILGGSQGAKTINEHVLDALPELVQKYYVVHQTGKGNYEEAVKISSVTLKDSPFKERYHPEPYLSANGLKMAAGVANIVVSRAGAGAISEIALWGKPSIIIPLSEKVSHDQRHNAFIYARTGAAVVIEEPNLQPHILISEIDRLITDTAERRRMSEAAKNFSHPDAARVIAEELLRIALTHEK